MSRVLILCGVLFSGHDAFATEWSRILEDGVLTASISIDNLSYFEALCDQGINIPITSMSLMVQGNMPAPGEKIEFRFGDQARIYAYADPEGVIASLTQDDAEVFQQLLVEMKSRSQMMVRLASGVRQTFPLDGSEAALAGCVPDAEKLSGVQGS